MFRGAILAIINRNLFLFVVVTVKSSTKLDKVVRREICSIQTKGTKRLSFIDGDSCDSSNQFLLAVCEKVRISVIILIDISWACNAYRLTAACRSS